MRTVSGSHFFFDFLSPDIVKLAIATAMIQTQTCESSWLERVVSEKINDVINEETKKDIPTKEIVKMEVSPQSHVHPPPAPSKVKEDEESYKEALQFVSSEFNINDTKMKNLTLYNITAKEVAEKFFTNKQF